MGSAQHHPSSNPVALPSAGRSNRVEWDKAFAVDWRRARRGERAYPDFARIVALNSFERFVFVMSILEKYSAQECSLLLRCSRRDVISARATAVRLLGSVVIATETQPENDFVSFAGVDKTK